MTPYTLPRWAGLAAFSLLYLLRVYMIQGFYIVTYALAIFLLNLLIAFLSPSLDPALELEMVRIFGHFLFVLLMHYDDLQEDLEEATLPQSANDEFRPFIRRLPEFKFWLRSSQAFLVAFVCTFVPYFDVPVFWPILVLYFFALFAGTMHKQIRHMIKYRYIPFSFGKKAYKGKEERPKK